mgnify:CR=1 FL=1
MRWEAIVPFPKMMVAVATREVQVQPRYTVADETAMTLEGLLLFALLWWYARRPRPLGLTGHGPLRSVAFRAMCGIVAIVSRAATRATPTDVAVLDVLDRAVAASTLTEVAGLVGEVVEESADAVLEHDGRFR